ncbi:2,4-dichlorophenol 6-monooxygenase [Neonectria ditissima]|uniref:2,4-dichlorophenol 6-monooxygenase n=1 Tax=Neonectria ditissima TaxID=78410 RepID=A0A0P7BE92_9HYPO|nr:2,4-dichlorophenol 6-monooxygenase [Neonectria ditissima]
MEKIIETDFLIAGAGPAGAALASFLGQHGERIIHICVLIASNPRADLKGVVIAKASSTAETPRAHVTNPPALECLRDIGIEQGAIALGSPASYFGAARWCRSLAGEEFGKLLAWSNAPQRLSDWAAASPCTYVDLPQSYLEPLLVKFAAHHGFEVRFSTELVHVERLPDGHCLCHIRDCFTGFEYKIRARFLFGADGGRSQVARDLDYQFDKKPSGQLAYNIFFKADLKHIINEERHAGLNFICNPYNKGLLGTTSAVRMVRPWNQWLLVSISLSPDHHPFQGLESQTTELIKIICEAAGDSAVQVEIIKVDKWIVRDAVARAFSDAGGAQAYLIGDAAHRHPPAYGLGSNTCIQDAYNLGWKVAFVFKGLAGPSLLKSYSEERQPVGAMLVKESNYQLRAAMDVSIALGQTASTSEAAAMELAKLSKASSEGHERRLLLQNALDVKRQEFESLGAAMNQWYASEAVYLADEEYPRPPFEGDCLVNLQISTYPGSRLPHAWLDVPTRKNTISTHDLAGKGCFCLFTGIGGEAWKKAANDISTATGIPVRTYGIGFGLEYHDIYRDWSGRREVEEDGCVLVRPDRFIAWRSLKMVDDCESALKNVLDSVLSRHEL